MLLSKLNQYIAAGFDNRFWYEESNASALRFCKRNNLDLRTFLTVVAILSPRVQVSRNIRLAKQWMLEDRNPAGMMSQRVAALEAYHATGVVSGTKINAFLDSLLLKPGSVCIDIHMSRIFGFGPELMQNSKKWATLRGKAQSIVRRLAKIHNVTSFQLQAILWCGYLRTERNYSESNFSSMNFDGGDE